MIPYETILAIAATDRADTVAIYDGNKELTWRNLEEEVRRLLHTLSGKTWQRAVFLSRNRWEVAVMMSAFATLRIPLVGLDYTASGKQLAHGARAVDADAVIYSAELARLADHLRAHHNMDPFCLDSCFFTDAAEPEKAPEIVKRSFESLAMTSGTTGFPKVVLRTKSFDKRRFADLQKRFNFTSDEVFLATIPFYHVSVLGWARLFLSLGGALVIAPIDRPEVLATESIVRGVTSILATPKMLEALCCAFQRQPSAHDVRFVITGGKHLSPQVRDAAILTFGPVLHEYYGTTETGVNAIASTEDLLSDKESSGSVLAGSKIMAVDDNFDPLPDGQVGRIAISSYQAMDRYLCGEAQDRCVHDSSEFIVTSDTGTVRNGRVYLRNRTFTSRSALNLYALEDSMRNLPQVVDVFAIAQSDEQATVYIAGVDHVDRAVVREFLNKISSGTPCATICAEFVDRIPYSPSGKPRLDELHSMAERNRG